MTLAGKNIRTRMQLDEAHLSVFVVQNLAEGLVDETELLLVEAEGDRKGRALRRRALADEPS